MECFTSGNTNIWHLAHSNPTQTKLKVIKQAGALHSQETICNQHAKEQKGVVHLPGAFSNMADSTRLFNFKASTATYLIKHGPPSAEQPLVQASLSCVHGASRHVALVTAFSYVRQAGLIPRLSTIPEADHISVRVCHPQAASAFVHQQAMPLLFLEITLHRPCFRASASSIRTLRSAKKPFPAAKRGSTWAKGQWYVKIIRIP